MKKLFIALIIVAGFFSTAYAVDDFAGTPIRLDSPPNSAATITPSDTVDLLHASRFILVGTTGSLKVDMVGRKSEGDGGTVTYNIITQGVLYEMRVNRIYNSSTAGNINALW